MKKPTLTVGIPAYNEAKNLPYLIRSIIKQNTDNFELAEILIVSDGSEDDTAEVVAELKIDIPQIRFIERPERKGKASALNVIYDTNTSDFLFTPDADVVMGRMDSLVNMIDAMLVNPDLKLVSARHKPAETDSFFGKCAVFSYLSLEDAFFQYNDGNNFYSVMSASMLRKSFVDSFRYPAGTLSDQCYVYAKATRENIHGYAFIKNAEVIFSTVSTFADWRLLGQRSVIGDKNDLAKHFGNKILEEYTLPEKLILKTQLRWFLHHPFYMTGSILLNMFIRIFPYQKNAPIHGMWTATQSSKLGIHI